MFRILAFVFSFFAMTAVVFAYFVKKKEKFLIFQFLCIFFLILSQLFSFEFFAAIGLTIALVRVSVYFVYEKKEKTPPLIWPIIFATASIVGYFIVNLWILKTLKPVDIICLITMILYAFIMRERSIKFVRYAMLVPTILSIIYYVLISAPVFTVMSYSFELIAAVVSIFEFYILKPKNKNKES